MSSANQLLAELRPLHHQQGLGASCSPGKSAPAAELGQGRGSIRSCYGAKWRRGLSPHFYLLYILSKGHTAELLGPSVSHSLGKKQFLLQRTCMGQVCLAAVTSSHYIPLALTSKDVLVTTQCSLMFNGHLPRTDLGIQASPARWLCHLPGPRSPFLSPASNRGQGKRDGETMPALNCLGLKLTTVTSFYILLVRTHPMTSRCVKAGRVVSLPVCLLACNFTEELGHLKLQFELICLGFPHQLWESS